MDVEAFQRHTEDFIWHVRKCEHEIMLEDHRQQAQQVQQQRLVPGNVTVIPYNKNFVSSRLVWVEGEKEVAIYAC